MVKHGVYTSDNPTSLITPSVATSGIPFVVGVAPVHMAAKPAPAGIPVVCTSWAEAVEKLGYSDDWKTYTLCEFIDSHFKLFACQPVVFCNMLDVAKHKESVEAQDLAVTDHRIALPLEALDNDALIVKEAEASEMTYAKGSDYDTYYEDEALIIEVLKDGQCYAAENLNVAYEKVKPADVETADIAAGINAIDLAFGTCGVIPDLLVAPGYSSDAKVAAAMAAKVRAVNGLFRGRALIDIDSDAAKDHTRAMQEKTKNNLVDTAEVVCWPMVQMDDKIYHLSTQLAGALAQTDAANGGCPYESPSNKALECTGMVLADGSEVNLTLEQANMLNGAGIVTALNFINGWTAWGNFTACYPGNTDVKDYFISEARMFDWIANTMIKTFWSKLDQPMNRRLIDTVLDTTNIWLAGLVSAGRLLAGSAQVLEEENPVTDLMAGIIRIHLRITPPAPLQEADFILEYDPTAVNAALVG